VTLTLQYHDLVWEMEEVGEALDRLQKNEY